jgi:protein-disulfide isomerase
MQLRPRIVLAQILLACLPALGLGCGQGTKAGSTANPSEVAVSEERIERIPGVDISQLTETETETWISMVNEQLSPCGDPRSVARCATEAKKCRACQPAAAYLTRLVTEGYDKQTIRTHYTGRFGKQGKIEFSPEGVHVLGAPLAPVTIVEFSDFQCPYCGAVHPDLVRLVREFEGQIKLVFKQFPLTAHARAMPAARAAEAAGLQGKFFEMHDLLFEHQHELEDADLERYANMLGLDVDRFKADAAGSAVQSRIDADRKEGERLAIEGTPTMYINGRLLREPSKALEAYLREELEL